MLAIEDLHASYDSTPVLRGVDLSVDEGEIVGVIGKNGAGKTTLMKSVIGLLEPDSGTIQFDGRDVTDEPSDARARGGMGYIPQRRDVFPSLTVEENLRMGESINEGGEARYDAVYEYFPILEERREQKAGTMSGGQQQMLAVGRALVGSPDLLLLDEPSEGVQPSIVAEMSETIGQMSEETETTVLFVEQNLSVIDALAERCYVMEKGRIVEELAAVEHETVATHLAV
ncbi:putative branched-chain amino acid transport ATP-binding protein LivG [Halalkalicoccus paucihalophilus]|uniref:Putative branched-chain amino acid transport ATP-binding protein LivG n=1 Tax=Halalkalicoccus paucihalophilus TaxID=1008153 RepID=A0A151A8H4_9EURY|nr:ABC transporter ATP-binding protein [Halalkalicoccus paucihalophilus]KYH23935.1 putative branched-chain amino acid transport ATP-binding protein LivG [Halalkalicoccus paucihalophilus]